MILPYDVHINIVWNDMQTAATLMDSVASGRKPNQLICSPSGFGKTAIAKQRFAKYGIVSEGEFYRSLPRLPENSRQQTRQTGMQRAVMGMPPFEGAKKRLFIESRPTKPISLVRVLYQCAMLQAAALLFDDPGKIAGDEASCDVLKTGFGVQRTVTFETPEITRNESWRISGHRGYDPFIAPPDFPIPADLRWLWLANMNYADPAVLARLGDHFPPLIARGLNPFWIRDDVEHDNHDLFLCVHYKATEENLLRSMGFEYEVSRKAVNFYVSHASSLVDLCPRRLELIAQAFAADQPPAALEAALHSMAPSIIRPKLQLPTSWVQVPDGVLLWPEQPFAKPKPTVEGEPPRRVRRRERDYKRLHPQSEPKEAATRPPAAKPPDDSDPEPPPPAATQPVQPDPEPDPERAPVLDPPPPPPEAIDTQAPESQTELPLAVLVPPELTFGQAIRAVYALDEPTCDRVADVLCRLPLEGCNDDELSELARALECCSEWYAEHVQSICHTFARYAGTLLFCTGDEVLVWEGSEKGLQIYRWDAVRKMMAPHIEEEERRLDAQLRRHDTQALLAAKLPPKRKLKVVKDRINRIIELGAGKFSENAQRASDHIRQMVADDPRFAECTTLERYLDAVTASLRLSSDTPGKGE